MVPIHLSKVIGQCVPLVFLMLLTATTLAQDDVSAELKRFTESGKVPGMAVAAALKGRLVASGASGVRKIGDSAKVTIQDKFHIGSCTKSMTGTLAAILVADGKINWLSTVADVFPDFDIHPDYRKATLLQMASNSGGVPGDFPRQIWKDALAIRAEPESAQREALVRALLKRPPAYPPGTRNVYSNGGFTIAGAMLERASGKSFADLARQRLFIPLGISSAGFGPPASSGETINQPYGHLKQLFRIVPVPPGPDADNPAAITPAGRCHLSIEAFAKFASFHAGTVRNAPLDAKALEFLHTPVAPSKDYAVGWLAIDRPWANGKAFVHNGSNTMFYAIIWVVPGRDFAAVAIANIDSGASQEACDTAISQLMARYLK